MPRIEFPDKLLCPITHEPFKEPVIAEDGHTYEKKAIEKWVKEKGNSPKTREKISNKFITNWDKKSQITEFLDEKKLCSQAAFLEAIRLGKVEEIEKLNYPEHYLDAKDSNGLTPLHIASMGGQSEMVIFLLKQGVDIKAKTEKDETPLHLAVRKGDYEQTVQLLLKAGAKIDARTKQGHNALHIAAYEGRLASCKLFIEQKIDIELKDNSSNTALYQAITGNRAEVVKLLLAAGADINAKIKDVTPLHLAAYNGHVSCA
ncbi:MAG: ankyrin repeat domain-containing protein, partial [Burkholderiales bacterium]